MGAARGRLAESSTNAVELRRRHAATGVEQSQDVASVAQRQRVVLAVDDDEITRQNAQRLDAARDAVEGAAKASRRARLAGQDDFVTLPIDEYRRGSTPCREGVTRRRTVASYAQPARTEQQSLAGPRLPRATVDTF